MMVLALLLAGLSDSDRHKAVPYIATPPIDDQQSAHGPMTPQLESPPARMPASSLDQSAPADLPQGPGPRGTSGAERYDAVGYAGSFAGAGSGQYGSATVTVAHPSLAIGAYVELTALDSGKTIVALVADRARGGDFVDLSRGAAQQLGVGEGAPVRVRLITPSGPDQMALRSGSAASVRIDAPDSLLKALRRRLAPRTAVRTPPQAVVAAPVRRTPAPAIQRPALAPVRPGAPYAAPAPSYAAPPAVAPGRAAYIVQVGAFSARDRAQAVARQVGGRISVAGRLFRVQMGPFADTASAQRARDAAARQGYGDARILHIE